MRFNELLPGRILVPFGCWHNAMSAQDLAYCLMRDAVWITHRRSDHIPNRNSPAPFEPLTSPVSTRSEVCQDNSGVWSHRTSGRSASGASQGWWRAVPHMPLAPGPCARVASLFQRDWIAPDRTMHPNPAPCQETQQLEGQIRFAMNSEFTKSEGGCLAFYHTPSVFLTRLP